jgi:hypothetical protein
MMKVMMMMMMMMMTMTGSWEINLTHPWLLEELTLEEKLGWQKLRYGHSSLSPWRFTMRYHGFNTSAHKAKCHSSLKFSVSASM